MATINKGGDDLYDPSLLEDGGGEVSLEDGKTAGDDLKGDDADDAVPAGKVVQGNDGDDSGFEIILEEGQEAGADNGALGEDDDLDDKEEHGKKVRARIERERRIARQARAQAENERTARIVAENKSVKVQKEALELAELAIDTQIKATIDQLRKAKEDGKTDDEITYQTNLSTLHARKEGLARSKHDLAAEEERVKSSSAARGPSPLAQDWKQRNPWYGHDRFGEQTMLTRTLDQQLAREGFDPQDPDYYAELDRRIRRRMPELQRFQRGGQQQRQQRRDPAGAVVRRDPPRGDGSQPQKGVIRLTKADQDNMRAFGIDLTDPKAVREYALQKQGGANG